MKKKVIEEHNVRYRMGLKGTKTIALLIATYLVSGACFSQSASPAKNDQTVQEPEVALLDLTVSNFKKTKGVLVVSVYSSGDTWLSEDKVAEKRLPILESMSAVKENDNGVIKLSLELPLGEYAISVYQDLNTNGKLDSNFIGIPKEPTAVSNDAPARFGPPKYKDAKFMLTTSGAEQALRF